MRKFTFYFTVTIVIATQAYAAEKKEITSIRDYYTSVMKKIKDGSLYKRELSLSYTVIPGIGEPSSKVLIYYDMIEHGEGNYDIIIVRIENYYQHAGNALYEELVYDQRGALIFYYGRQGQGSISSPDGISWTTDERFYYQAGRLVRVMYGQDTHDIPTTADIKKGERRFQHAQRLRERDCDVRFPSPLIFSDDARP
jgi:hypothetical protein